jgi:multifunctional methyltransferase subunit TRM112|tara:strand:+ start:255 stop:494 length:240 start_codon:yes stop_codon:yes gene_type:complete
MLGKLDWTAFVEAAKQLNVEGLPEEIPPDCNENETFLKTVHHALLEVTVVEGHLECPESGRKFPIENTIPNMLLNENEV